MHALYDGDLGAARIAEGGVAAGIEFDTSSGPPIVVHEIKLEGQRNE
jgi:ATP-dependent protease HslVU (ClpYQ) peptidase subunit